MRSALRGAAPSARRRRCGARGLRRGRRGRTCDQRLAKVAEKRGVSVEQLKADIKTRLLARIDAAEKAGRISSERATKLRERVAEGSLCGARRHVRARIARHGDAAARRRNSSASTESSSATSCRALARRSRREPGQERLGLEKAMVAPAKARLAKAVADGKVTQAARTDARRSSRSSPSGSRRRSFAKK